MIITDSNIVVIAGYSYDPKSIVNSLIYKDVGVIIGYIFNWTNCYLHRYRIHIVRKQTSWLAWASRRSLDALTNNEILNINYTPFFTKQYINIYNLRIRDSLKTNPVTHICIARAESVKLNTLRPRQNDHHSADDVFNCIFLNENVWIATRMSWMFVPRGTIINIPALFHLMAWHRQADKP